MKLYEIALVTNETLMLNLEKIESVAEQPHCMAVTTVSGERFEVVPQTLLAAFDASKVEYFKFQRPEPEAQVEEKVVEQVQEAE